MRIVRRLFLVLTVVSGVAFAGAYDSIIQAATNDRTEEVIDFLQRGMDVNTADPDGSTLLALAARNGNTTLVEFLLRNKANINRRNRFGDSPVLLASIQGHRLVVEQLVEAGVDLNPEGWTPLHYSVIGGHQEVTRYLLANGVSPEQRAPNGRTAFLLACQAGRINQIKFLLVAGADHEARDFGGKSGIDIAREKGAVEVIAYLESLPRNGAVKSTDLP
jgi:ankyrin repeat protein